MSSLNRRWSSAGQEVEAFTDELFLGVEAGMEIFGNALGRKFKGKRFENALNRALFEVQTYYLSFAP